MPALIDLKEELNDITTLKLITSALTEASAARLKKIREGFERNIKIYQEISNIYHLVRVSASKEKAGPKVETPKPELKNLSVAMTSNQRFYGNINTNIMRKFVEDTHNSKTDLIVIGLTGQGYMKAASFGRQYESLNFAKDIPSIDEAKAFIEKTQGYNQIFVYYPQFVSLVNQAVGIKDITQAAAPEGENQEEIKILFEPELPKILDFFNRQVRSLLFIRMMLESDLSLTAARLLSMSAAEERSDDLIKEKKSQIRKTMTSFINAQLLDTFASIQSLMQQEEQE